MGQLIAEGNVWVFLLCVISAAVVAPISEEFLFRVLLQGWLEALEHRWRRQMPTLRRLIPRGTGPILLTSLLFARLHFRVERAAVERRLPDLCVGGRCGGASAGDGLCGGMDAVARRRHGRRPGLDAAEYKGRYQAWLGGVRGRGRSRLCHAGVYSFPCFLST